MKDLKLFDLESSGAFISTEDVWASYVTGRFLVAQKLIKLFRTEPSSNFWDPGQGSQIAQLTKRVGLNDFENVQTLFPIFIQGVVQKLKLEQSPESDPSERLAALNILSLYYDPELLAWFVTVELVMEDSSTITVALP